MLAVFAVLLVLSLSIVIVRVATVGLSMTGLSKDLAHFQAVSAFTGSGFTTRESEEIVNHPLRRRITVHLMLLGHAGIAVAISSVILSFVNTGNESWLKLTWVRLTVLSGGGLLLWLVASSEYLERVMWQITSVALRRFAHLQLHDYTRLLRISSDYVVSELEIRDDDWLAGRTLEETQLAREGVLVLGIEQPDGTYLGAPHAETKIMPGDCLIVYGKQAALLDLDTRRADIEGNMHHVMAVTRQLDVLEEEQRKASKTVAGNTRQGESASGHSPPE